MKKIKVIAFALFITLALNSCATILLQGKASECQRTKPVAGQPQREIRVGYLIFDLLLFWPGAFVDFATAEIYKPCE